MLKGQENIILRQAKKPYQRTQNSQTMSLDDRDKYSKVRVFSFS